MPRRMASASERAASATSVLSAPAAICAASSGFDQMNCCPRSNARTKPAATRGFLRAQSPLTLTVVNCHSGSYLPAQPRLLKPERFGFQVERQRLHAGVDLALLEHDLARGRAADRVDFQIRRRKSLGLGHLDQELAAALGQRQRADVGAAQIGEGLDRRFGDQEQRRLAHDAGEDAQRSAVGRVDQHGVGADDGKLRRAVQQALVSSRGRSARSRASARCSRP